MNLLEDDVRRWFDNLADKSYLTDVFYLRDLGFYCELNKTDSKALLKVVKTKLSGIISPILSEVG